MKKCCPPNRRDDLCLCFSLHPSSMYSRFVAITAPLKYHIHSTPRAGQIVAGLAALLSLSLTILGKKNITTTKNKQGDLLYCIGISVPASKLPIPGANRSPGSLHTVRSEGRQIALFIYCKNKIRNPKPSVGFKKTFLVCFL